MASIANDPGGRRRIIFKNRDRDRKAIWLGKISKRLAEEIKTKVESINTAAIAGHSIDGETAEWLGKIGDVLHAKLAAAGLVTPRQPSEPKQQVRLGDLLEGYISGRTDVKPSTRTNLDAARRRLVEFFGADKAPWGNHRGRRRRLGYLVEGALSWHGHGGAKHRTGQAVFPGRGPQGPDRQKPVRRHTDPGPDE